jgi:hypothetical protein
MKQPSYRPVWEDVTNTRRMQYASFLDLRIEHPHTPDLLVDLQKRSLEHLDSVTLARPYEPATSAQLLATPDAVGRRVSPVGCWNMRFNATTVSYDLAMGRASRTKRERREDRSRVASQSDAVFVTDTDPVTTAVEKVPAGSDVGWGGPRTGAGRPRIYASAAARQAAYRARKDHSEDPSTSL